MKQQARRARISGQQLALILVLVGAAAASALVPWMLTSRLNSGSPALASSAPMGTPSPSSSSSGPVVVVVPSTPAAPTPGPSPTPTQPRPTRTTEFRPIAVEAEDPANTRPPGADVAACVECSGGYRVRYIAGTVGLKVPINVPTAGNRSVTIVYETDSSRTLVVSVNGVIAYHRPVAGRSWDVPESVTFTAWIPAGKVTVTVGMSQESSPDIDKIVVS